MAETVDAVRVDYFKIVDMELACRVTEGWAYYTGGIPLSIGDIVEVPPTPYTNGKPGKATVLHLDANGFTPRKTIIRRLNSWDDDS
jgi:hypothetical protein